MCQVAFDALLEAAAACRIGLRRFAARLDIGGSITLLTVERRAVQMPV